MAALETLLAGLAALRLSLHPAQQQQLLAFIALLEKWNQRFNLTSVHGTEAMIRHHLLDSLSILPFIQGESVLDVGSGAGLPGFPLAVARPDWRFVLLDSNGKKTRFMQQVLLELRLPNVTVVQARIEQYRPERAFDTVVSRAFSGLAEFIEACRQSSGPQTRLCAMKGQYPQAELQALQELKGNDYSAEVIKLSVPGLVAERHLVSLQQTAQT
ncbi:MAG TPA: 16S rRNA (guanine(527)-N(7))-methyltransferase RsmG [Gammaproteobacteria bacterium]